jgi:hypothetical protein
MMSRGFSQIQAAEQRLGVVGRARIDHRLVEEFFEAVREYIRWAFSRPQSLLASDRYVQLCSVCRRVASSTERLPPEVFDTLYIIALHDAPAALKEELSLIPTYGTAGSVLWQLIEAKTEMLETTDRRSRTGGEPLRWSAK